MTHELMVERAFHVAQGLRRRKEICARGGTAGARASHSADPRLMALAIRFDHLISSGQVVDQAQLADLGGVSRARLTQVMNLVLFALISRKSCCFSPALPRGARPSIFTSFDRLRRLRTGMSSARKWIGLSGPMVGDS